MKRRQSKLFSSAGLSSICLAGFCLAGCAFKRSERHSDLTSKQELADHAFLNKYTYRQVWGVVCGDRWVNSKMRRSFFILDDPFVFSWREVESKSWVSESGRIISFAHRKTLQFTASEDVEAVCYGSGREVDCVEFYLKAGTVYKLIGHDNGLIPIKELAAEESQGRAFIRIKRTTKDHRVVDYCYEIEADGRLNRTVSTFIYDEQ